MTADELRQSRGWRCTSVERLGTVGIVGVGLIGASLGMALRQRKLVEQVVGVDIDPEAIAVARARGAIDHGGAEIELVRDAEIVVVAVPPDAVVGEGLKAAAVMKTGSILTDVASIKVPVVSALEERLPAHVRYIGGHPMAGSEGRGAEMAHASLLDGRPFLLTPTQRTDPGAVTAMIELTEQLGMLPVLLAPDDHDDLVAQISHLPYLVAVAAVGAAGDRAIKVSGPAFSGLARIASSPVTLWAQICRGNRDAIKRALHRFRRELDQLERALDDADDLIALLERSRRRSQGN